MTSCRPDIPTFFARIEDESPEEVTPVASEVQILSIWFLISPVIT